MVIMTGSLHSYLKKCLPNTHISAITGGISIVLSKKPNGITWKKWLLQSATWACAQVFLLRQAEYFVWSRSALWIFTISSHKIFKYQKFQRLKFPEINIANYCFHIHKWNWLFIFKQWKYGMKNVKLWCPCLHLC